MGYANGYVTTITAGITNVATTCAVASTTGIPSLPFTARIVAEGTNTDEIVLVTANAAGTFTITRAYEPYAGNGASAHGSGATLAAVVTAGDLAGFSGGGSGLGALVLLEQHSASNSASIDFTSFISGTYDTYVFEFINVLPATNSVDFWCRASTGGTFDTGSNYVTNSYLQASSGNVAAVTTTTQFVLRGGNELGNSTTWGGITGELRLFNPQGTSMYRRFSGNLSWYDSVGATVNDFVDWWWKNSTGAMDAVRFLMSSGNIASGAIRVYGIAQTQIVPLTTAPNDAALVTAYNLFR